MVGQRGLADRLLASRAAVRERLVEELTPSLDDDHGVADSADASIDAQLRWLCSQARGERVLAMGIRAPEVAVHLARDGFDVIVVDPVAEPVPSGQRVTADDAADTGGRIRLIRTPMWDLPQPDGSADTVLLDESLHDLSAPDRVVGEAVRVLRPEGRLVATMPIGPSTTTTTRPTVFPHELLEIVTGHFSVLAADVVDGTVRIVAEPSPGGSDLGDALRQLDEPLSRLVVELHANLLDARSRAAEDRIRQEVDGRRIEEFGAQLERFRAQVASAKDAAGLDRRRRTAESLRMRERISQLEQDREKLRYELRVARWKLNSLRSRRWWRLGGVLADLRRRPSRLLLAPLRLAEVVLKRTAPRPRPTPLSEAPMSGSDPHRLDLQRGPARDVSEAPVPRRLIPVGTILAHDEFRRFEHEWHAVALSPTDWSEVLREDRPALLFVSSLGVRNSEAWEASSVPDVAGAFGEAGVPTAFWHPETDTLPPDLALARTFDVVFCGTDALLESYRADLGHDRVFKLTDSTQPRLANPVSVGARQGVLVLRWEDEANDADPLREAAMSLGADVVLCRVEGTDEYGLDDGPVERQGISLLAKRFEVVVPPGRRPGHPDISSDLLDLAATGTPLVTTPSPALTDVFGRSVVGASTVPDATDAIRSLLRSDDLRARSSHQARRATLRWTTSGRAEEVLSRAGVASPLQPPSLTMMIPTNRPENLQNLLRNVGRQDYPNLDVLLVLHGIDADDGQIREEAARHGVAKIDTLRVDGSVVLGEVFNRGFAAAPGEFVGKMDDDDFYGAAYASDLMACFDPSGADIVGKWTHFAYIEQLDSMVLRFAGKEHSYQEILAISTLIMKREILEEVSFPPMPAGSGSAFLRKAGELGATVYAGDRFNYLYIRSTDDSRHTWSFSEFEMAARSDVICKGMNIEHVVA